MQLIKCCYKCRAQRLRRAQEPVKQQRFDAVSIFSANGSAIFNEPCVVVNEGLY